MSKRCHATGKVRHPNKVAACIVARKQKNSLLNVFPCAKCKGWHLGRSNDPCRAAQRIGEVLERYNRDLAKRLAHLTHTEEPNRG